MTHSLSSADAGIFSLKIRKFCYTKKYRIRLHFDTEFLTLLTCLEFLNIALVNMVTILIISVKIATLGIPKIKDTFKKR